MGSMAPGIIIKDEGSHRIALDKAQLSHLQTYISMHTFMKYHLNDTELRYLLELKAMNPSVIMQDDRGSFIVLPDKIPPGLTRALSMQHTGLMHCVRANRDLVIRNHLSTSIALLRSEERQPRLANPPSNPMPHQQGPSTHFPQDSGATSSQLQHTENGPSGPSNPRKRQRMETSRTPTPAAGTHTSAVTNEINPGQALVNKPTPRPPPPQYVPIVPTVSNGYQRPGVGGNVGDIPRSLSTAPTQVAIPRITLAPDNAHPTPRGFSPTGNNGQNVLAHASQLSVRYPAPPPNYVAAVQNNRSISDGSYNPPNAGVGLGLMGLQVSAVQPSNLVTWPRYQGENGISSHPPQRGMGKPSPQTVHQTHTPGTSSQVHSPIPSAPSQIEEAVNRYGQVTPQPPSVLEPPSLVHTPVEEPVVQTSEAQQSFTVGVAPASMYHQTTASEAEQQNGFFYPDPGMHKFAAEFVFSDYPFNLDNGGAVAGPSNNFDNSWGESVGFDANPA